MISLPDVNVLIALSWTNHPHHDAAHRWFAKDGHLGWATCLLTQSGFLRLSLNGHVVGVSIGCTAAVSLLQGLVGHAQHQFVELAPGLTAKPFDDLITRLTGYRQVTDATLLHLARAHGLKLITFDQAAASLCPWPAQVEVLVP